MQQCTLLSIKTGGCSEDCSYCPQSSRYSTGVKAQKLMSKDAVIEAAKKVCCFPVDFLYSMYTLLHNVSKRNMWNVEVNMEFLSIILLSSFAFTIVGFYQLMLYPRSLKYIV